VPILAVLALAGSLAPRWIEPFGLGTPRTDTPTFVIYLVGVVAIFAVLTFLSVLVLAPFAQALSSHMLGQRRARAVSFGGVSREAWSALRF
jgi:K+-transporting ATPase A subunit